MITITLTTFQLVVVVFFLAIGATTTIYVLVHTLVWLKDVGDAIIIKKTNKGISKQSPPDLDI